MKLLVSGYYRMVHLDANGEVKAKYEFPNLVLNQGLDRMLSSTDTASYMHLSTNSTAPAVSDTSMGGTVVVTTTASTAVASNEFGNGGASTYIRYFRIGRKFTTAGTYSSIGVSTAGTDATLYSKALIKDAGNTPTSITIAAGESLDIQYEMRLQPDPTTYSGTVTITGVGSVPYSIATFDHGHTSANNAIPGVGVASTSWSTLTIYGTAAALSSDKTTAVANCFTPAASNSYSNVPTTAWASYTAGSYTRQVTFTWPTSAVTANNQVAGVYCGGSGGFPAFAVCFATPIPKTNLQTLALTFSISLARA